MDVDEFYGCRDSELIVKCVPYIPQEPCHDCSKIGPGEHGGGGQDEDRCGLTARARLRRKSRF